MDAMSVLYNKFFSFVFMITPLTDNILENVDQLVIEVDQKKLGRR